MGILSQAHYAIEKSIIIWEAGVYIKNGQDLEVEAEEVMQGQKEHKHFGAGKWMAVVCLHSCLDLPHYFFFLYYLRNRFVY